MENQKLAKDIEQAINRHSAENGSDTPDFMLAEYLVGCLEVFNKTTRSREIWYGRGRKAVHGPVPATPMDTGSPTVATFPPGFTEFRGHPTMTGTLPVHGLSLMDIAGGNACVGPVPAAPMDPGSLTGGGTYPPDGVDTEDDTPAVKPFSAGPNEVSQLIDGLHSLLKKVSHGPSGSGVRPSVTPVHCQVFARYHTTGGVLCDTPPVIVADHNGIKKAVSRVHADIVNGITKPSFENATDNDDVVGYSIILRTIAETSV
jgi:hypothetical protein